MGASGIQQQISWVVGTQVSTRMYNCTQSTNVQLLELLQAVNVCNNAENRENTERVTPPIREHRGYHKGRVDFSIAHYQLI